MKLSASPHLSIRSGSIQQLTAEIARLESVLERNKRKQVRLLSVVDALRHSRRANTNTDGRTFAAIDAIKARHIVKQLDLQLTSTNQIGPSNVDDDGNDCYSEASSISTDDSSAQSTFVRPSSSLYLSNPCIYNHLLDRIQRLEQYLTRPCRHCQQACLAMNYNNNAQLDAEGHSTSVNYTPSSPPDEQASPSTDYASPWNSNLQQPIIMQGHINNQQVTLFNRSAVELVAQLKQIHSKRNSLQNSYGNILEIISHRDDDLSDMNALMNQCTEQLHAIENLKSMEDMLQDQSWENMYKLVCQVKSRSSLLSKLMSPKNLHLDESLIRVFDMVQGTSAMPLSSDVSLKQDAKEIEQKERKVAKDEAKFRNKNRKKERPMK